MRCLAVPNAAAQAGCGSARPRCLPLWAAGNQAGSEPVPGAASTAQGRWQGGVPGCHGALHPLLLHLLGVRRLQRQRHAARLPMEAHRRGGGVVSWGMGGAGVGAVVWWVGGWLREVLLWAEGRLDPAAMCVCIGCSCTPDFVSTRAGLAPAAGRSAPHTPTARPPAAGSGNMAGRRTLCGPKATGRLASPTWSYS